MRYWAKSLLLLLVKLSGIFYKSPSNFNYWWNFGFMAMYFLLSQIITGILLAMFYNANSLLVFNVVYDMSTEVYYGWWLRYLHANGASFFFIAVYLHMARNIYYGSFVYPSHLLWMSGVIIWVLMMATAFLGYMLPWGQMSFWGAMVITSLLGAIPGIGIDIVYLLWGGFSIENATLHRFYSLHFTLPFVIFMLVCIHFVMLHEYGSNNPLGIMVKVDNIPFVPYYGLKDGLSIFGVLIFFCLFIFYSPDFLGHSDNFLMANSLVTPEHIVPEWYFLPLYAILRSVTNKLMGIFLMAASICCLLFLPFICKSFIIRSTLFRPLYGFFVWIFFCVCFFLGIIGGLPVMSPYFEMGFACTMLFFVIILVIFPLIGYFEHMIYLVYFNREFFDLFLEIKDELSI